MNTIHGMVPMAVLSLLFAPGRAAGNRSRRDPVRRNADGCGRLDDARRADQSARSQVEPHLPDAGEKSAEISILHEDPVTHATHS
jgi:hypothetical protein